MVNHTQGMDEDFVQTGTMHPYFGMESSKRAPSTVESIADNAGSEVSTQDSLLMSGLTSSVNGPNGPGHSDPSGLPDLPDLPVGSVHIPQGMTIHYNPSITTSSTMMGAATRTTMSPMPNWLSNSSTLGSSSMVSPTAGAGNSLPSGVGNGLHHHPHYYHSSPWRHTVPSTMPWASLNGSPQMKFTASGTADVIGMTCMSLQTTGMTKQPYYERFPLKQLKRKCHYDTGSFDAHMCFHEVSGTRPNKVYISEERMAARMQELTLENNNDHLQPDRESSWGQGRRSAERLLREVEERLSSEEEEEEEDANHNVGPRIELDAQLQLELKERTKDLLPSFLLEEMAKPNMQLVLWKPPGDQVKEVVAKVEQHQKLATKAPPGGSNLSSSPVPMPMDAVSLNGISPSTNSLPLPDLLMNHQSSSLQGKPIGCNGTSIAHNHSGPPQANPLSGSAPLDTVFEGMDDDMEL